MGFIKRMLLLATLGSMSVVLAGCYGMPAQYYNQSPYPPADLSQDGEPVSGLTASDAPLSRK